jgi:dienelactone hydrolase
MVTLRGECVSEVIHESVHENGLVGELLYPASRKLFPAVLCIGGSSGGVGNNVANKLADEGFVAFSVGYFGAPGLPNEFANLPIEYFLKAIQWFSKRPMVKGSKIGVTGSSRGSEAALELATRSPLVGAVVVYVPSGVRWNGVDDSAPWTLNGAPLPFAKRLTQFEYFGKDGSVAKADMYNKVLDDASQYADADIEVEKASCPILLVSGKDDQLWPSERMAAMVVERVSRHKYPFEVKHVAYENAGHRIKVPGLSDSSYMPVTEDTVTHELLNCGGTFEGNKIASEKAWPEAIKFFKQALIVDK